MKIKYILIGTVIYLISTLALAYTNNQTQTTNNYTQAQIRYLEKQVQSLKVQIKQLNASQKQKQDLEKQIQDLDKQIQQLKSTTKSASQAHIYPFGPVVLASPYLGTRPAYDASDLITNTPDVNEDMMLLKERQKRTAYLKATGQPDPGRPLIELSGYVEGKALQGWDYNKHPFSDVDLSGVELKILAEVSSWATAYAVLSYDDQPPMLGYRASNSNVYISRAFATIGNLDKFPVYGTVGQLYLPFGTYYSYMITDPLTKTLARSKERPIVLGFKKDGFFGSAYGFKGDSYTGGNKVVNNWGVNLGYHGNLKDVDVKVGAGFIYNIADSEGMQDNALGASSAQFSGFGNTNNKLQHQVPALDLNASFDYKQWDLVAEFITGLRSFDVNDLMYNGKGANVSALNIEGLYEFNVCGKPATLAAGYQQSWQALALNIPKQTLVATAGISLFKDTIEKIEYRHDINYGSGDYASGGGVVGNNITGASHPQNVVTAQVDFYF